MFCSNVRQEVDSGKAKKLLQETIDQMVENKAFSVNQKIALLEKIKNGLMDEFPDATTYVAEAAKKIEKEGIFLPEKAKDLGYCLFEASKETNIPFDLDILLKAARLIFRYDNTRFKEVKEYMESNKLGSYLSGTT